MTTIVTSPATIASNPSTLLGSGGITSNSATLISGGGTSTTLCITTDVPSINFPFPSINIFPNPFSFETILKTNNSFENTTLVLYNVLGQEIKEIKNISGQEYILSRGNLKDGIYFICLMQDNKRIMTTKLMI